MAGEQWAWGRVLLGSGESTGIAEGQQLWFVPQCERVPDGGVSMTRVGSSWVFGKEAAPGAAMGCGSWAFAPVTELPPHFSD